MRIVINIRDRYILLLLLLVIAASGTGLVLAYGGSTPAAMGHTWGEMICDSNLCISSGKVGIGTTNPQQKLDVAGGRPIRINSNDGYVEIKGDSGGWATGTYFIGSSGTNRGGFGAYGSADSLIYLWAGNSYISPAMVWNNGNVGIGTTSPTAKLDVIGTTISGKFKPAGINGDSGQSPDYYGIYQEAGPWDSPFPDLRIQYHTGIKYDAYAGYGGHQFYTGYDGTGNPTGLQMQITDKVYIAGNLGIGAIPSPSIKLDVVGAGRFSDTLYTPRLIIDNKWNLGTSMLNDEWLRLVDLSGSNYYGGFAAKNIWANNSFCLAGDCKSAWPLAVGSAVPASTTCSSFTLIPGNLEVYNNKIGVLYSLYGGKCPPGSCGSVTDYKMYYFGPPAPEWSACTTYTLDCGACGGG